jgi:hypothetical protein
MSEGRVGAGASTTGVGGVGGVGLARVGGAGTLEKGDRTHVGATVRDTRLSQNCPRTPNVDPLGVSF